MQANWRDPEPEPPRGPSGGGVQMSMPPWTPMVKRLMILNGIIFAASFLAYLLSPGNAAWITIADLFGIQPALWVDWFPLVPVWQLISWGFLHSVSDPFHIVGNMLFLFFLGSMLETLIGGRRFLAVYVSALLVSGLATLSVGVLTGETRPTLGASGAVLCIVVAMAVLRPHRRIIFLLFPITLRTLALIYVGADLFFALLSLKGADASNVARLAHLVGAGWGFVLARQGWIWRDPVEEVAQWKEERDARREQDDEHRLDELLDRINREGIGSLSSSERAFLKRVSKRR